MSYNLCERPDFDWFLNQYFKELRSVTQAKEFLDRRFDEQRLENETCAKELDKERELVKTLEEQGRKKEEELQNTKRQFREEMKRTADRHEHEKLAIQKKNEKTQVRLELS